MSLATITKSIRLSQEESAELADLSKRTSVTEATLMKQWVREGIQAKKIDLAVQAYMERKIDLRGAAAMADVSYNRFLQEIEMRNIVILDNEGFTERLNFLAEAFADEDLATAVDITLDHNA